MPIIDAQAHHVAATQETRHLLATITKLLVELHHAAVQQEDLLSGFPLQEEGLVGTRQLDGSECAQALQSVEGQSCAHRERANRAPATPLDIRRAAVPRRRC
jgi:hypothetical protein